jgi:acetoin utilization deacetylase AcuC-like enzyme
MPRTLFYTHHHTIPLPPGHKFPIDKYRLLYELLNAEKRFLLEPAPLADQATVELVHDREYVSAFMRGALDAAATRRIGFPWSEQLVARTMASVGGTLAATREALAAGWGGNLAGGTHHAFRGYGSGFCVFNDIAVAIRWLSTTHEFAGNPRPVGRAAVIDLDVHQGDGTAHIFQDDPDVLTISLHCKNNFPLQKQRSKIDVELEAGTGDEEYLDALEEVLPRVVEFAPGIVFYQAGVDALKSDTLGRLSLTPEGLKERDRRVIETVRELGAPLVITMGGGYSSPIAQTAEAHANTFRMAEKILSRSPAWCLAGQGEGRDSQGRTS